VSPGRCGKPVPDDAGSIVAVLADAFDGDPFFRWMSGPPLRPMWRDARLSWA
jgi:hypothetical protein